MPTPRQIAVGIVVALAVGVATYGVLWLALGLRSSIITFVADFAAIMAGQLAIMWLRRPRP